MDLSRRIIAPGRELLLVVGTTNLNSGSLIGPLSALKEKKIKLIKICTSALNDEGLIEVAVFMDITEASVSQGEIRSLLESLGVNVKKTVSPSLKGMLIDTLSHPLVAESSRVVILRDGGYRELLGGLREYFGANGESFLYHVGFRTGLGFGRLHKESAEKLNLKDPVEIYRNISAAMFQWAGFGILEVLELTPEGGSIVVRDSFECELGRGRTIPYSQFVRGMIAGILSELFGKGFNVVEEQCIAKGDPHCKFSVRALKVKNHR